MYRDHLDLDHPLYWTVDDVLSADECAALIARIDASDPEVASVNAPGGPRVDTRYRNNDRVIFDDPVLAQTLYARVEPHVPIVLRRMTRVGANERFRCYRYAPGQYFAAHHDGSFERANGERSLLTFMVYLNAGFTGGRTAFLELGVSIEPRPGRALLFQHPVLHEGGAVESGVKYAIRSDIMYRPPG